MRQPVGQRSWSASRQRHVFPESRSSAMCVAAARVGMGERCALEFLQPICFLHSSWVAAHKTDHLIACAVSLFTWGGLILYPSSVSIILFCQALPRRQGFIEAAVQGRRNACCICDHFEKKSHLSHSHLKAINASRA